MIADLGWFTGAELLVCSARWEICALTLRDPAAVSGHGEDICDDEDADAGVRGRARGRHRIPSDAQLLEM